MNYNKVIISGRITHDIELRTTPNGKSVANISLAINKTYKKDGEKKEEVTFVNVALWGRTAEVAHQYSGKGQPLFVEGRLETSNWTDKESGEKRSRLEIVGESIQLLGSKRDNKQSTEPTRTDEHNRLKNNGQTEVLEGDAIPFNY